MCRADLYCSKNGKVYRRKSVQSKYHILNDDRYISIDDVVYRKLKIGYNQFGYKKVKLSDGIECRQLYVHRIMYRTFVGVIQSGKEVNHIDHDKSNNSIDNLELLTHSENLEKQVLFYGNKLLPRCKRCGRKMHSKMESEFCTKCLPKDRNGKRVRTERERNKALLSRVVKDRPPKEVLWSLISSKTFLEIGRIYGVSDNAIRKWCKLYDLPFRKKDIEQHKLGISN